MLPKPQLELAFSLPIRRLFREQELEFRNKVGMAHLMFLILLKRVAMPLSITHILNGRAAAPIWGGRHR